MGPLMGGHAHLRQVVSDTRDGAVRHDGDLGIRGEVRLAVLQGMGKIDQFGRLAHGIVVVILRAISLIATAGFILNRGMGRW